MTSCVCRRRLPAGRVIALLGSVGKDRHQPSPLGMHEELHRRKGDQFHAGVDGVGVSRLVPAPVRADGMQDHAIDLETVLRAEGAKKELGAKLVKAVSAIIVGDGVDALQRIKSVDHEVILLDLMLPRLNGFEVVRELAALDPEKLGRIIVLTAASESTLKDFHIGSIYRLIKKPFDITDLLQAVDDCAARNGH